MFCKALDHLLYLKLIHETKHEELFVSVENVFGQRVSLLRVNGLRIVHAVFTA